MAFHYHHATQLRALFPQLYSLIKAERAQLPPQKAQTIVVGNLDTENFLRSEFLSKDGILMGIEFPFLETALEDFYTRLETRQIPDARETWFSLPPQHTKDKRTSAGMLEFELTLLELIQAPQHTKLWQALGYTPTDLNELKGLALAHKLAMKLRDYLLHVPETMADFAEAAAAKKNPPIGALWRLTRDHLEAKGYAAAFMRTEKFMAACRSADTGKQNPRLYLFGMPMLSAFHAEMLAALSLCADVYLMGVDLANDADSETVHANVAAKFLAYRGVLKSSAAKAGSPFSEVAVTLDSSAKKANIEFWSLPGNWRGAEILGDHWHEQLTASPELRQNDIQVVMTDLAGTFAAFEKALGERQMIAASRTRFYEKAHALAELLRIFSNASASLSRESLLSYWISPVVQKAFRLDAEKIELYQRAFEIAQGFRNDYPDGQSVFNISEAITRLMRGSLVAGTAEAAQYASAMPAQHLREFETAETFSTFLKSLDLIQSAGARLGKTRGPALIDALVNLLEEFDLQAEESDGFLGLLEKIRAIVGDEVLSLAQLAVIVERFAPKTGLKQSTGKEGVLFSALGTTCFTAEHITLLDLNEDLDRPDDADVFLPEFMKAPTRLAHDDSVYIALESARLSGAAQVIYAFSHIEPASGAEKYPSHALSNFEIFLGTKGIMPQRREKFSATMLDFSAEGNPPLSSDADAKTLAILQNNAGQAPELSSLLTPATDGTRERGQISVKELERFLISPAESVLRLETATLDEPARFRRDEPKLAVGNTERLKFCDDYLVAILADGSVRPEILPSEVIRRKQLRGEIAPEGFDHALLLLAQNQNDTGLMSFASEERARLSVVEYILQANLSKAFSVRDAERLERRYLPAPVIEGVTVSGTIGRFYEDKSSGTLYLIDSAIYPERTINLVRLHLRLCLMLLAASDRSELFLAEYKLPEKKSALGILAPEFSITGRIQKIEIVKPEGYIKDLLTLFFERPVIWFDLALLTGKKLGSFTETDEQQLADILTAEPKGNKSEKADYLRRYYNLKPDEKSFAFFEKFILPVAKIDAAQATKKGKKAGKDG